MASRTKHIDRVGTRRVSNNRSALDELAGRSGKGPDDDPRRLDARGLLQFFRARIREKSLAAAPTDLLPASSVCQVRHMRQCLFHVS